MSIYKVFGSKLSHVIKPERSLRQGQIIQGKILKIFPEHKAQIQLGGQKMIAKLEAALSVGNTYHFQVQSSDEIIYLKVLGEQLKSQSKLNVIPLMNQLQVKTNKVNNTFVQSLINDNIPFDKTQLKEALQILGKANDKGHTQQILLEMIGRRLPITENVFQALSINNSSQYSSQIEALLQQLNATNSKPELLTRLEQMVMNDKQFLSMSPKEQFMLQIGQLLTHTGLAYEHQVANHTIEHGSLKAMLLQLVQQTDGPVQEKATQLIHFINGMQLNSIQESASMIQASLQIPAEKLGLPSDLELEFESKKTEDGKINPDYCRVLFYLDLNRLKQTIVDMHIQKRSVTVTIYNDFPELKTQTYQLQPVLKQGLEALEYRLTSVDFKPIQALEKPTKSLNVNKYETTYKGVDYLI